MKGLGLALLIVSEVFFGASCASNPLLREYSGEERGQEIRVPEANLAALTFRLRDLERENKKLLEDLTSERAENQTIRERIRKIEHPFSQIDEEKMKGKQCVPEVWVEYGGKLININEEQAGQ